MRVVCVCVLPTQNMTWLTAAWPQTAEMSDVRARLELVSPSHSIFPVPKKKKKKFCPLKKYQGYILSVKHSIDQSLYVMRVDSRGWDYRFWPLSQDSGTLLTLIIITDHQRWAPEKEPPLFCSDLWSTLVNQGHRLTNLILPAVYRQPIKRQTRRLCRLQQSKLERAFTRVKAEPYRPGMDRCWCVRRCKWRALWLLHPRPRKIDSVALRKDTLMKTQSHACEERRARCIFGPKFIFWRGDGDGSLAHGQVAGRDMS